MSTGLLGVLRVLPLRGPLLIAIDDVHWLDAASTQALAFAARRLVRYPAQFLLATRDHLPPALQRAFAPGELARLELEPWASEHFGACSRAGSERV